MYRIFISLVFILFCLTPVCYAAELPINTLIRGVNQARMTIQSGEVLSQTTTEKTAQKTEKEITTWIQKEKERELKNFRLNYDVKQYEKDYLIPYLKDKAKRYRKHTNLEYMNTLFNVQQMDNATLPRIYQYKLTAVDSAEYPLDDMPNRFRPSDDIYLLAYDMQTQVKDYMGDILHAVDHSDIYDDDKHYGFLHFSLSGRSHLHVPSNAKLIGKEKIEGVLCHILAFIAPDKRKVQIWVDPEKDFSVHKIDYLLPNTELVFSSIVYKQFKRINDVWFPQVAEDNSYNRDGSLWSRSTTEVIAVELNMDFPKDFFKINKEYYGHSETEQLTKNESSPTPQTIENETLLLHCGPQSLSRICELLKVETNLNELKKLSGFTPDRGTTMLGLKDAATYKGLSAAGVAATVALLKRKKVPLPAIAYVDNNHFIVLEAVDTKGVKISDPVEKYKSHLTWEKLSDIWEGDLLIFDKKKKRNTKQENIPLAFSETPTYNFGKALGGSEIKHTFTIKNIGKKPLEILSVTETCVCTASVLSQEKILPGKTGDISTTLIVPADNKLIKESLIVLTNDPIQSTLTLSLQGESFTPINTFPELIAFGNQKPLKTPLTKQISLHVQDGVEIQSVKTDTKYINAILRTKDNIPHADIQFMPTLPAGKFTHTILIDYTYKGERATYSVAAFGEIIGELRVVPNRLFFGLIKDPTFFSKTITVSSLNTEPFNVTAVESKTKAVNFTLKGNEKKTDYKLTATISSEAKPGEISGEVIIHTSSTVQPTVRVSFFGIIAGSN